MTTIAFKADNNFKIALEKVSDMKGITLSALIKMYLTKNLKEELSEITQNGITVGEELDLLFALEKGSDGKVYSNVELLIDDLK
jgi:hypothetical protein